MIGVNVVAFITQCIVFLILLWVLAKFVYPVMLKTLDKRAMTIREGVENAEKARAELANAEKRVEALLNQARLDAQATLSRATQAAEHMRAEIEQDAHARARDILVQADKRIDQEIAQARAELSRQVADLAILAAERVISRSLDDQTNRQLVNEFVANSRDLQC